MEENYNTPPDIQLNDSRSSEQTNGATHANGHTPENPVGEPVSPKLHNGHTASSTPDNPKPSRISASKLRNKRARATAEGEGGGGGSRVQTVVQVMMPNKQWWIRCHPDPNQTVPVDILVVTADGNDKLFFLDPDVVFPDELNKFAIPARITRSITSSGIEFFLLAKQSAKSPKDSTRAVINAARKSWIQVSWEPTSKGYVIEYAKSLRREPVWSASTLDELLEKAFGDNYIDRADHAVINNLLYPEDEDQ
jgi:hypothetical protein